MFVKIVVSFVSYFFYWFCCFLGIGTDKKSLIGLRSYPDAVQQAVLEHPKLDENVPKKKSMLSILIGNFLLFTVVFFGLGLTMKSMLGLNDFWTAFCFYCFLII